MTDIDSLVRWLDVRSLIVGILGTLLLEWARRRLFLRSWKPQRDRLLNDLYIEILWIWGSTHNLWSASHGKLRVFEGCAADLRDLMAADFPANLTINPKKLTIEQRRLLGGLVDTASVVEELRDYLDRTITRYNAMLSDEEKKTFLETIRSAQGVIDLKGLVLSKTPMPMLARECYRVADVWIVFLDALDPLAEWMFREVPDRTPVPGRHRVLGDF